jgi:hypothetical protein
MKPAKSLMCAAVLSLSAGQASAELYTETCFGMSGYNYRLHCYVGYTEPDDQEYLYLMHAQCKETLPFANWGPHPAIPIIVTSIPQMVTAMLSIGSCPEGTHTWHPKVYLDFAPNNSPYGQDGWYEYPEDGDNYFFVCYT